MSKLSLKKCKRIINSLPYGLSLKSELLEIHKETINLIGESKKEHANIDYYNPRIKKGILIIRNSIKNYGKITNKK